MIDLEEFRTRLADNLRSALSPATAVVAGLAIVMAVVAGPFGTFDAMFIGQRIVFWGLVIAVSVLIGSVARALTSVLVGIGRPVLFDTVAAIIMTVLFAPAVWAIGLGFDGRNDVRMPPVGRICLYVFVVSLAVFLIRRVLADLESDGPEWATAEDGSVPLAGLSPGEPRLLRRLSPEMRGPVLRLSGQDHHVVIATDKGTETLRLRLSDAIAEMEPVDGFCSHRSHWVARAAIDRVERESGQKLWLVLSNGDRVPISRKYRPGLEKAGVIDR